VGHQDEYYDNLRSIASGEADGFEPEDASDYISIRDRVAEQGHGNVSLLRPAEEPLTLEQNAHRFAASIRVKDGASLDDEYTPAPKTRLNGRTPAPRVEPGGPPPDPIDPDVLAFCTLLHRIPNVFKDGGQLDSDPSGRYLSEFTTGVYLSGIQQKARRLRDKDPTMSETEAVQAAAAFLVAHEQLHFAVNVAGVLYSARTGQVPDWREGEVVVELHEKVANATGARALPEPVRSVLVAVEKAGRLPGYSDLAGFIQNDCYADELRKLGRRRFGEEHGDLIIEALSMIDFGAVPVMACAPTDDRCALTLDVDAYEQRPSRLYIEQPF
jgi:hypothetical protein